MNEKQFTVRDECNYASYLNSIYDENGFQGVLNEIKEELEYGSVSFKNGLYCITTGGWSDDEFIVHSLINPVSKMHYHYCGYIVGGAFFFSEDKVDINKCIDMVVKE